jgi:hypothetical protein
MQHVAPHLTPQQMRDVALYFALTPVEQTAHTR